MTKEYKKAKLKNGEVRYVFDVSLGVVNGKRKRTTVRAKTVKEGRQKVAELQLGNQMITPKMGETFEDVYRLYLSDVKSKIQSTTYNQKEYAMVRYDVFMPLKINRISSRDIQYWYDDLKVKRSTKVSYFAKLSAFFTWALRHGFIETDPTQHINIDKRKPKEMEYITEKEFWKLYQHFESDQSRMAFLVLMYTGLRKSELCGLSRDDLIDGELHLHHTAVRIIGHGEGVIIKDEFKNEQSKRIVPLPHWLIYDLRTFLESSQWPFKSMYSHLYRPLNSSLKRAEMKHMRVHDFRHSYAAMLINKGVDIYTLQKLMGHSSVATTSQIYAHLYDEKRKSIADLF